MKNSTDQFSYLGNGFIMHIWFGVVLQQPNRNRQVDSKVLFKNPTIYRKTVYIYVVGGSFSYLKLRKISESYKY